MSRVNDLADRRTIEELVALYEAAEADIRTAFGQVDGALENLRGALSVNGYAFHLRNRYGSHDMDWKKPDDVLGELRRQVWDCLIDRMQIRKAMSIAAWKELQDKVQREDPPAITRANVEDLVAQFREEMPAMLEAAVHEVFSYLRPPGSRYKTNTEFELGERAVLTYRIDTGYGDSKWRIRYDREQEFIAMENVFRLLDGRMGEDPATHYSQISVAVRECKSGPCHGETEWVEFKGFKNGNLHLRFKRMDLIAKLNQIAGGARLKPVTEAA